MNKPELPCPDGHGLMSRMVMQDAHACCVCGWGVTGLEVAKSAHLNWVLMLRHKVIGRSGSVWFDGDGIPLSWAPL